MFGRLGHTAALGAALSAALLSACGSTGTISEHHGPAAADLSEWEGAGGDSGGSSSSGPECEEGTTRVCRIDLGTHGTVKSCFEGIQTCTDGAWGACGEPPVGSDSAGATDSAAATGGEV